jgi:hypothetical protein
MMDGGRPLRDGGSASDAGALLDGGAGDGGEYSGPYVAVIYSDGGIFGGGQGDGGHGVLGDLVVTVGWGGSVDFDLHLLNPAGSSNPTGGGGWLSQPNDCFYLNRQPDWGTAGVHDDDPSLDIDDTGVFPTAGGERIYLPRPEDGTFTVGVHYYCDNGLGARGATVRIFCFDQLAALFGPKSLASTGTFWEAATVTWPGCLVAERNLTYSVDAGCPPDAGGP